MIKQNRPSNSAVQIASLTDISSPEAMFEDVKNNFIQSYPVGEFHLIRKVFYNFRDLFDGRFPGYRSCNTLYHDKLHSIDTLLAISRLIDGCNIRNKSKLPVEQVKIAMIATLLHDSGFIQTEHDTNGTGAKYTNSHIKRSIGFMKIYFPLLGLTKEDFISANNMVQCTGIAINLSEINFKNKTEKTLGFMLGTADLLGQMAGRNYLEKLLLLYREFSEGKVQGYESEFDLLRKSIIFWEVMRVRLTKTFEGVYKYAKNHFSARYKIGHNLYEEAIQRQIDYLSTIIKKYPEQYNSYLRRR